MYTLPAHPNTTPPTYTACLRAFQRYTLALLWTALKFFCTCDRYQKAKHLKHILALSHDGGMTARLLLVALATTPKV
jgi:hypothetical protein